MHQVEFRAMGSPCRVVVDGVSADVAESARSMVERLENLWTRFDPDSEVSHLNDHAGRVVLVSNETYTLLEHAKVARRATAGRFNPLMLDQLEAHGYAKNWDEGVSTPCLGDAQPGTDNLIELFPEVRGVCIPEGCRFDPGGIGKGLAADLVTEYLVAEGAESSSVELGGDIRMQGVPWYGHEWRVGVTHPFDSDRDAELVAFTASSGAVATSSRLKRRWVADGRSFHHLLDPLTGFPAETDVATASCYAATAWWAEVAAKVALISGSDDALELLARLGVAGVVVTDGGQVHSTADDRSMSAAAKTIEVAT